MLSSTPPWSCESCLSCQRLQLLADNLHCLSWLLSCSSLQFRNACLACHAGRTFFALLCVSCHVQILSLCLCSGAPCGINLSVSSSQDISTGISTTPGLLASVASVLAEAQQEDTSACQVVLCVPFCNIKEMSGIILCVPAPVYLQSSYSLWNKNKINDPAHLFVAAKGYKSGVLLDRRWGPLAMPLQAQALQQGGLDLLKCQ